MGEVADVVFNASTLPFYLTIILGWLYVNFSHTGDPADISNRVKINCAIFAGVALGIVLMIYEAKDLSVLRDYKAWIRYILVGYLVGSAAIGINQQQKNIGPVKGLTKHLELRPVKPDPKEPKPNADPISAGGKPAG